MSSTLDEICGLDLWPYCRAEVAFMVGAVDYFRPRVIFDWGTNIGSSARIFYEATKGVVAGIHTIEVTDPSTLEHAGPNTGRHIAGLPVKQHFGDGATTATRLYWELRDRRRPSRPMFYLDGDHRAETVARELTTIDTAIEEDAVILIHDTLSEASGPHRAVKQFLNAPRFHKYGVEWLWEGQGMVLLWVRNEPWRSGRKPVQHLEAAWRLGRTA